MICPFKKKKKNTHQRVWGQISYFIPVKPHSWAEEWTTKNTYSVKQVCRAQLRGIQPSTTLLPGVFTPLEGLRWSKKHAGLWKVIGNKSVMSRWRTMNRKSTRRHCFGCNQEFPKNYPSIYLYVYLSTTQSHKNKLIIVYFQNIIKSRLASMCFWKTELRFLMPHKSSVMISWEIKSIFMVEKYLQAQKDHNEFIYNQKFYKN